MSTAEFPYRILLDPNSIGDATNAMDAITARAILSNLNHLADEFAQVGLNMSGTKSALSGKSGYLETGTPTYAGTPYLVGSHTWPIKVRQGGQSYRMRVRIGGASGNTASTKFWMVLGSAWDSFPGWLFAASDSVFESSATTSSTAAWLTGTSMGPEAYTTMIEMSPRDVSLCTVNAETLTALGGDPATVQVALVTLSIFASTANVAHIPRLYAAYAAEYIGT